MKMISRVAVCATMLAVATVLAPHATFAACSSGGTVSNVNDCVPEGLKATDCALEWSISPVPPLDPKKGVPTNKIVCMDNDPACDADTLVGQCTFNVGACVNVVDGRFTCTPTDVTTYLVKKPSTKDATRPDKNKYAHDNRVTADSALGDLAPTAATNVCSAERPFVVPLKKGKKATLQIQGITTDAGGVSDKDSIKFTCLPNPAAAPASARQNTAPSELIGGPLAMGRVGDWIIENDRVRFVIRDVGRDFSFMLTYGGHLMDADYQRASGPGRDNFLGMTPLINVSSTDNPTSISVVSSGAGGGPAVLQTSGPDDLFDPIDPAVAIKGFSQSLSIPPFAIDNNIPVTVRNEYTLAPGDEFMKLETIVQNDGTDKLEIYVGDYTSGGGQLEVVAPGLGFGDAALRLGGNRTDTQSPLTFDWLGWFGFGESQGVSYGLIPEFYNATSAFTQSGVVVPIYAQNLIGILSTNDQGKCTNNTAGNPCGGNSDPLCVVCEVNSDCVPPHQAMNLGPCKNAKPPGFLAIEPGGMNAFRRWFALSDNGMGKIVDARNTLVARGDIADSQKATWVQGTVTVGGVPVGGARVVIATSPGDRSSQYGLVDVFETRADGYYQGTVPKGEYRAMVKIPGYPYEGGGASPLVKTVAVKKPTTIDFDVPPTGFLRVDVTNGVTANPLPAKISVVGLAQAVDPGTFEQILGNQITASGNLFGYDAREKVTIHGLPQVQFAGVSGSTPVFPIQPGTYQIVVSHGPEYSVSKQNVTVVAGDASTPQVVTASVVPVVDTTGFVSADHHVHLINSPDSTVSKDERIVTMLAEGLDYFVASDHDFKTDLTAEVAALGASSMIKFGQSDEVTYFDSGHFGAYPVDLVPGSVTGGSIDWGRAGVAPGLGYPSDGSYDLSVDEMALTAKAPPHNATVVQANHFNSGTLGYFRTSGIDTTVAPPQSSTQPARIRQNPAITNLFSNELTALEIWIESSRDQNALALGENLGDYFNMLNLFDSSNPLQRKGIVCDSDTHSTTIVQAGGPRNMLASATDDPALLVPADLADSVNAGRNVCTSGPDVRVSIEGDGGAIASHDLADPLLVPATSGNATLHVDIQSPTWAEYDRIEVYVNNVPSCVSSGVNFLGSQKKVCTPTPNFVLTPVKSTVPVNGDFRLESSTTQPLTITQDSWVMVVVRGQDNVSKPLFPMNPQSILPRACSGNPCRACGTGIPPCGIFGSCGGGGQTNLTLAELTDGNLNQCGVLAMAIANPLFVDFGGDGLYKGVALP
jgi:hypothetical protein